ncbi:EP300-interacting inhibitor of differentiation 3-like [Hyperolius riggenbachi]|uniref:EP300-interacting inhibitor of differentiation 3-like n=1 Tax=Hyperolius riggenbachi TaxID=752182 RepID=UPI0035A2ACCD
MAERRRRRADSGEEKEAEEQAGASFTIPTRDTEERRDIRAKYRRLMEELQDNREELMSSQSERLTDTLLKANELFRKVSSPREAALDLKLILQAAKLGNEVADRLLADKPAATSFPEDLEIIETSQHRE